MVALIVLGFEDNWKFAFQFCSLGLFPEAELSLNADPQWLFTRIAIKAM